MCLLVACTDLKSLQLAVVQLVLEGRLERRGQVVSFSEWSLSNPFIHRSSYHSFCTDHHVFLAIHFLCVKAMDRHKTMSFEEKL